MSNSYDHPRFIGRTDREIRVAAYNGTFTASDAVRTETNVERIPMARACKLLGAAAVVQTAGASAVPKFTIMQSTNVGVTLTLSHTAGAPAVGVLTETRSYTAGEVAGVNLIHTGTASAVQAGPATNIALDLQDQFA